MLLCVLLARYGAFELEFQANPTIINIVNMRLQRFATKSGTDPNHGHISAGDEKCPAMMVVVRMMVVKMMLWQ